MNTYWTPLQSIPRGGTTLVLEDQVIWQEPLNEFGIPCRIVEPLSARITVLPQAEGVLFRGTIKGTVSLPCDRCAVDSSIVLEHAFDSFESFPVEHPVEEAAPSSSGKRNKAARPMERLPEEERDEPADSEIIRIAPHGGLEINPAAIAWQEFSLALPIKPLCELTCKGLCPLCGKNRNIDVCSCEADQGDPRLAALRGLTVAKKS